MNQPKETALQALSQFMGDDYLRARHAFSRYTPEQMEEQHGESGHTRAEILQGYEDHVAKVDAAIEWVKAQA